MLKLLGVLLLAYLSSLACVSLVGVSLLLPVSEFPNFIFFRIPLAFALAEGLVAMERVPASRSGYAVPVFLTLGMGIVWFYDWTVHPTFAIPVFAFALWRLFIGKDTASPLAVALAVAILTIGNAAVLNLNYLAAATIPKERYWDSQLLATDLALYAPWLDTQEHMFPLVHLPMALTFLEHAYVFYFVELFLVAFVVLRMKESLTCLFATIFSAMAVGMLVFFLMPALGPFTYAPDAFDPAFNDSLTYKLLSLINEEYHGVRAGAAVNGFGYFAAMPSMHVAIAVILQTFLWPSRVAFWTMLPVNVLLALATFLLGCHYFLDIPAGLLVAGCVLGTSKVVARLPTRQGNDYGVALTPTSLSSKNKKNWALSRS